MLYQSHSEVADPVAIALLGLRRHEEQLLMPRVHAHAHAEHRVAVARLLRMIAGLQLPERGRGASRTTLARCPGFEEDGGCACGCSLLINII